MSKAHAEKKGQFQSENNLTRLKMMRENCVCLGSKEFLVHLGAFNLLLLEFTFIYQFYSRKTILVESIFWNVNVISQSFQTTFFDIVCYLKLEVPVASISFEIQQNGIWTDNIQSCKISFHFSKYSCKYS